MQEQLHGRARSRDGGTVYLYSKWSNRLFTCVKVFLLILTAPLWLPFYALMYLGYWSEIVLDFLSPLLDRVLVWVVPRSIGRKRKG